MSTNVNGAVRAAGDLPGEARLKPAQGARHPARLAGELQDRRVRRRGQAGRVDPAGARQRPQRHRPVHQDVEHVFHANSQHATSDIGS